MVGLVGLGGVACYGSPLPCSLRKGTGIVNGACSTSDETMDIPHIRKDTVP
jgi:hypothetical protein